MNKPENETFGILENVLMTPKEYEKLLSLYGEWKAHKMIDDLSLYLPKAKRHYDSHYLTILNWIRREQQKGSKENRNVEQLKEWMVKE